METLFIALGAILAGAFAGYFLALQRSRSAVAVLTSQLQELSSQLQARRTECEQLQQEKDRWYGQARAQEQKLELLEEEARRYHELQAAVAETKAQLLVAQEKLATQAQELAQWNERFKNEFRNLAQGILEEKTKTFTEANEQKMRAILDPLKAELGDFKKQVQETYDKESKERFSLGKEIQRLVETSQQVGAEANNLTTALKGNTKLQGNWGEMILESILENSGLAKEREYFVQQFIRDKAGNLIRDEEGKALQPDVTLCYPDGRKVIVDSKVSLLAWERYVNAPDPEVQAAAMKEHLRSVYQHIDGLSRKNYPRYAGALDYVLMFVPVEPAFLETLKADRELWRYAYDKKVLLVSPTNLLAVLRIIADLWKVEKQNRHAIEIAEKAGALYDKFHGFLENMEQVGKKIGEAENAYNQAFRQLSTGRGNLITRVEELKRMGANASKQLPDRVLNELNSDDAEPGKPD